MKILSYNLYGFKNTNKSIPKFEVRQKNIERILNKILIDKDIKVCCFQEVNKNNINLLEKILNNNNFKMLDKFPMKSKTFIQYNIIAIRNEFDLNINFIYCLPHSKDMEYKNIDKQIIDYDMSQYRTTVFVSINYKNINYLIGNIHVDHISIDGKINGTIKSLNYMDKFNYEYKILIGDMNMISHMSEVYNILKQNNNYITLSRNKKFNITDNSWHGYGIKEQVNIDYAFIEKNKKYNYEYEIIKQNNLLYEGSDHRPIIITIY